MFLGKRDPNKEGRPYEWKTYKEAMQEVESLLKGLKAEGVCQAQTIDQEKWKLVGILAENREEWTITELACMSDSITIVPIFMNHYLTNPNLESIINQTELQTIFVSSKSIDYILDLREQGKIPTLKTIVNYD